MAEKLSETDINRLRGVVGLGAQATPEKPPIEDRNAKAEEPLMPKPKLTPKYEPRKVPENTIPEKKLPPIPEPRPEHSVENELFVKIDEHAEVASKLIESKKDIKAIADTISLLTKAENLKAEAIERLETHLNELDAKLDIVEEKLIMPEDENYPEDYGMELGPATDVSSLHKTLENLKEQLNRLE